MSTDLRGRQRDSVFADHRMLNALTNTRAERLERLLSDANKLSLDRLWHASSAHSHALLNTTHLLLAAHACTAGPLCASAVRCALTRSHRACSPAACPRPLAARSWINSWIGRPRASAA